jgi:hypothetical protein
MPCGQLLNEAMNRILRDLDLKESRLEIRVAVFPHSGAPL